MGLFATLLDWRIVTEGLEHCDAPLCIKVSKTGGEENPKRHTQYVSHEQFLVFSIGLNNPSRHMVHCIWRIKIERVRLDYERRKKRRARVRHARLTKLT